ncbi:MAG: 30S ribosomal protein S25e [Thermoprotei archaeon]
MTAKKSVEAKGETLLDVPAELVERLKRDVKKGFFKVLTPYSLAQAYDIKISLAKKLLRIGAQQGFLELYSGGRRSPIYIPKKVKQ